MKKIIEKIIYSFGISGSFYNVSSELTTLQNNLPKSYLNRDAIDIGCGDGKISLKLEKILSPKTFRGIDVSKSLVKSANKNGIKAKTIDVEKQTLSGDLGILWGVLHHFNNPPQTLSKLYQEFNSLIIREPINSERILELGHKYSREEVKLLLKEANIKPIKIVETEDGKSIIIFT